ncbi:histidine phosphatase family protein [Notoacmeibacter ruber]|uniref:Histidine phosphatase family protein n=1 Tax=Notoacmeibacter ruber TaxID=2670375 RepID=A0A3L7JCY6_9HYPH|nr:histidine phosphatase family protein [Notoacmeibacter ruber]RLQ87441.1 histidine phosphatase family protein [Notoacmeibacter ruber]
MPDSAPIYLIRHGQTDWNAESRLQGQTDRPLNETGKAQALANGRSLGNHLGETVGAYIFVSSPMLRTCQTMRLLRQGMGLPEDDFRTDPRLKELSFGAWEGSTFEELERREPGVTVRRDADKWNYLPPGEGAESYQNLLGRVRPFFDERFSEDRPTVCVAHGGILRCAFRLFGGLSEDDAAAMAVPQDRVARIVNRAIGWL